MKQPLIVGLTIFIAFLIDQTSKWLILNLVMQPPRIIEIFPFFNLRLGFNTGVSFGLFSDFFDDWPIALASVKLLAVVGLTIWALAVNDRWERIGLSLMAGGALGNI